MSSKDDGQFVNVYPGPPKTSIVLEDEELTDEEDGVPSARNILARTKERSTKKDESRHERVRADALQLLQMANDPQRKERASLQGWNTVAVNDSDSDDDNVHVVSMGNPYSTVKSHSADLDTIVMEEELPEPKNTGGGRWSNRYSVASTLKSMKGPIASGVDEEDMPKSANNMYRGSRPTPTKSTMGSLLRTFSDRFEDEDEDLAQKTSPNKKVSLLTSMWLRSPNSKSPPSSHRMTWKNVNLADRSKELPETPFDPRSDEEIYLEHRQKRLKRFKLILVILVFFIVVLVMSLALTSSPNRNPFSKNTQPTAKEHKSTINFLVTADTYRPADEKYLNTQLYDLPKDSSFMVHLGDLSWSQTSLCARSVYSDASSTLKASPLPTFVLPGDEDWNNCPRPSTALTYWREHLGQFEQNFQLDQLPNIDHPLNREESFSFFKDGLLLLGLNLVDGNVQSEREWSERHVQNVQYTEQQLHNYQHELKAVILFGHAAPTAKIGDYFWPVCTQLRSLGIPMLYIHASSDSQEPLITYQPFTHTPNLYAIPTRPSNPDVGSPFIKVSIDANNDPDQNMFEFMQI